MIINKDGPPHMKAKSSKQPKTDKPPSNSKISNQLRTRRGKEYGVGKYLVDLADLESTLVSDNVNRLSSISRPIEPSLRVG